MEPSDPQLTSTVLVESAAATSGEGAVPPRRMPGVPEVGDFVGRYRIRERIGEGGMGLVYAAEDRDLGRLVAIKLLRPVEGAEAEVHRHRLLREAQALARVSHRNLVMVFDVGTHEGRVWIAMEHVIGDTLEDWLAAQPRRWEKIVDVFIEAGRGLVAVHEAGLVHRDFKPSNVIVRGDGTVQVLDFGLAAEDGEKIEGSATDESRARPALDALAATLTETGGIMGTPAYMAPEQFLRLGADARSDQFSFCVALFEALYGYRPFKGHDLAELMMATVEGLAELPPELPGVPELLRRSIARGLHREPDSRFPDLEALLFALERSRAPAPADPGGDWRRFALGVVVGGGVLALGIGAWVSSWTDDPTLDPEPEVLLITAPVAGVPDAVAPAEVAPPPKEAPPAGGRESTSPQPANGGAAVPTTLPGVDDPEPARVKGETGKGSATPLGSGDAPPSSRDVDESGRPSKPKDLPGPVTVDTDRPPEPPAPDAPKSDSPKPEPPKSEPPKSEPPKPEPPKPEPPKSEPPKSEPPPANADEPEPGEPDPSLPEPPKAGPTDPADDGDDVSS